jgi:transcriptional regulator with PAS, ATPase and Fis domain
MARIGRFREDLYDRLSMDTIRTPPLRERLDDIPSLAEYFIGIYVPQAKRYVTDVSQQVAELFQKHSWPGNIRELEDMIRRAVYKGRTELIRLEDLPFDFAQNIGSAPAKPWNCHELMRGELPAVFEAASTGCAGAKPWELFEGCEIAPDEPRAVMQAGQAARIEWRIVG